MLNGILLSLKNILLNCGFEASHFLPIYFCNKNIKFDYALIFLDWMEMCISFLYFVFLINKLQFLSSHFSILLMRNKLKVLLHPKTGTTFVKLKLVSCESLILPFTNSCYSLETFLQIDLLRKNCKQSLTAYQNIKQVACCLMTLLLHGALIRLALNTQQKTSAVFWGYNLFFH